MKNWFVLRMLEPSTWRGVGGLVTAFGLATGGQVSAVISVGIAIISAVETMRSEGNNGNNH